MATRLPAAAYLEYWQVASEEEFGLCVQVHPDDARKFEIALYEARKECGGYENLMVMRPEPQGTFFIMKQTAELPD